MLMFTVFILLVGALLLTTSSNAFNLKSFGLRKFASLAVLTIGLGAQPDLAKAGALDAALKTAMSTSDSKSEDTRAFDALPPAAKKRRAIALCKESDSRKAAGYVSASECTAAVVGGDFSTIVKGKEVEPKTTYTISTPAPAPALAQKPAPAPAPAVVAGAPPKLKLIDAFDDPTSLLSAPSPAPPSSSSSSSSSKKLEKVVDLTDLSPSAKKRRATAACKKADTRKFAKMGSESKCTERVLANDYAPIIEALEYGK